MIEKGKTLPTQHQPTIDFFFAFLLPLLFHDKKEKKLIFALDSIPHASKTFFFWKIYSKKDPRRIVFPFCAYTHAKVILMEVGR
jgi:hypothetical protein